MHSIFRLWIQVLKSCAVSMTPVLLVSNTRTTVFFILMTEIPTLGRVLITRHVSDNYLKCAIFFCVSILIVLKLLLF